MAATPEKKVKDKVRKILTEAGVYHFMPATHGYGTSGVPDIVGCYHGRMFAIECKSGNNKPTALQLKHLAAISDAGGCTAVINEENIDYVRVLLSWMLSDAQGQHKY